MAAFLLQPLATQLATRTEVFGTSAFAEGGAIIAGCMEKGLLSYKVVLMPLELYTIRKNAKGDKEEHWEVLVEQGRKIRAEEDYREPAAIHGLVFPDGKQELELILRRREYAKTGTWLYRKVDVSSGERMTRNEPVVVHCKVRPGQGFAQVEVQSEVKGVFSATVNWERMEECEKPILELSYIPKVAYIVRNDGLWNGVRLWINKYYMLFYLENGITEVQWRELRNILNKSYRDKNSEDIYRYSGPLNNAGILEDSKTSKELNRLATMLLEAWNREIGTRMGDQLLRIGGWLYLYIHDSMAEFVQRKLEQGETKSVYLHVAGLTFHTDSQLNCFYDCFCREQQYKNEWFRSLRNIVRFRDSALSEKVLSNEQAKKILDIIVNRLDMWKPEYGRKQIYDNCIQVFVYLLKRRRYDENFLRPDDPQAKQIEQALQRISEKYPTKQYRDYAQASLKFLSGKATHETVKAVLEAVSPADGEDD